MNQRRDQPAPIRTRVAAFTLGMAFVSAGVACPTEPSAKEQTVSSAISSSKRMADGKEWATENLTVDAEGSYCYGDADLNCRRYGRLYTWESAQHGCQSLGDGWRLPTNEEWWQLAKHHGGVREDSADEGQAAYTALSIGGSSGFNALLGGSRDDGRYERLDAHGLYWTASETSPTGAWFYNFGKGGASLNRHRDGRKLMALSVRCIRD